MDKNMRTVDKVKCDREYTVTRKFDGRVDAETLLMNIFKAHMRTA